MQVEKLPQHRDVGEFEIVFGELIFFSSAYLVVLHSRRPIDFVNAVDILEEGDDALEAVRQLGGYQVEIEAAALLEISELRDLHAVEHHLPADAPGAERGRFP